MTNDRTTPNLTAARSITKGRALEGFLTRWGLGLSLLLLGLAVPLSLAAGAYRGEVSARSWLEVAAILILAIAFAAPWLISSWWYTSSLPAWVPPLAYLVVGVGPVDRQIGVLRLDRENGQPLAVVYNFACHPIQGVPNGGNTADIVGFASKVIEDNLSPGTVALFLQGCAGDINPVFYKDVDHPRDAEPLGNRLGLSTLAAARQVQCRERAALKMTRATLALPRADLAPAIASLQAEQTRLLDALRGTSLNLKTFMHLAVKHGLSRDFPSYYSHHYLQEKASGHDDLGRLDTENRRHLEQYVRNIHLMEQLTRTRVNLDLLRLHHAQNQAAGSPTIDVEMTGLRVGDFVLVTFPGELSVEIGLGIKRRSPHRFTFVAGCTNGYIYYAPTAAQLKNRGGAQEDSDCLLAPEWQALFEKQAAAILARL